MGLKSTGARGYRCVWLQSAAANAPLNPRRRTAHVMCSQHLPTVSQPWPAPNGRKLAAVLVPLYDGQLGPTLLLIRRSETINHPGQVAFPGGRPEPGDSGPLATALREANEELGIEPQHVRLLGPLPVVETMTSNYAIYPFVGRLTERPSLRLQASEVAAVLDVPLSA